MGIKASASVTIADISDGTAGTGIASTVVEYQAGSSGTTAPTGTWSATVPATSASAPYLWTRVTYTYTDGSTPKVVYSVGSTPEGIEIGGRNLLSDTQNFGVMNTTGLYLYTVNALKNGETYDQCTVRYYSETIAANVMNSIIEYRTLTPEYGQSYTFSFWAKGSGKFRTYFYGESGYVEVEKYVASDGDTNATGDGSKTWTLTEEWKRYWITYTLATTGNIASGKYLLIRHDGWFATDLTISIAGLKLEKGNKTTDWTPAPEDIDSKIETVSSALEASEDVIVGTQKAATASWTGVAKFSELKDGQRIAYWLPYSGVSNTSVTLNLTLSNGSKTGAINCYYGGTSRLKTHYPAGNVIHFTYKKDISINGSSTKYTGWWADANYDSGNTYDRTRYSKSIKAGSTSITAYNIIVGKDGTYTHLKLGNAFDISYPILYAASSISSSATGTNNYLAIPFSVNTTQSITLAAYKPVYIKGKLSGALFTPVSTTPLTQTVPTSADGYQYILLGTAYSSSEVYLLNEHPIFQYHNGAFKTVQQIATEAAAAADSAQASADEANESILAWCYNNDKVYINGGKIYAGTVSATQIAAKAVTADKLSVSMLSAITANLGAVTAGSINIGNGQFVVSSAGNVTSKNITATGGTIGGWKLTSTRLASSDSISIGAKEAGLMFINESDKPYIRVQDSSGAAVFQLNRDGTTSVVGDITATNMAAKDAIYMYAPNAWGNNTRYKIIEAGNSTGQAADLNIGNGSMYIYLKGPTYITGSYGDLTVSGTIHSNTGISTSGSFSGTSYECTTSTNYSKLAANGVYVNTTNSAGTVWNEIQMRLSGNSGSQGFSLVGYLNGTQAFWHTLADSSGNTTFGKNLTVSGTISSSKAISVPGISYTTGQVMLTNKSYTCGLYDLRFGPSTDYDNKANLGIASARWVKVYAASGTIGTSDERDKDIIGSVDGRYKRLYMALNPIMYRWKDTGIDRKVHIGLGAQTTERSAASCGIMFSEIGMIEHDYWDKPSKDGRTDRYGMNYQEVAVLTVPIVQEHEKKIENLTNKIESLQNLLMAALDKIALQNKTIEQLQENKEGE